jgi:hypothetical protein
VVDETSIPLAPRKLRRNDWRAIELQLRGYFSSLTKSYEADAEEFFERVIAQRERRSTSFACEEVSCT